MTLAVGAKASRTLTLTSDHVQNFAEMTGDYNPLHFDESFAAKTKFGRLVVQGGLTTGLLHALVAMDLPRERLSEPRLEVHSARIHRRHDHRRSRGAQRPRVETGHTARDSRDSTGR